MKKLFFILFIIHSSLLITNAQWYPQNAGTNATLFDVYFIDENTGWICGFGIVLKTTNSGTNWTAYALPNNFFNSIHFTDNNTGWICGSAGLVYKTTDAGGTWNSVNAGTTSFLKKIRFVNSSTGIIAGYDKTILKTTNGGLNWNAVLTGGTGLDFYGCKLIDANTYFILGTDSHIYKTTNGGASWDTMSFNMVNPLHTSEFINSNVGWATGCCGIFLKTTNGGSSWTEQYYLTLGYTLYILKFINPTTGFTVGDAGIIYRTTNGAVSWDSTVSGTDQTLYSISMVNANTGWVVGNFGMILKTTNGGGPGYPIGINQTSSEIPNKFSLSQNYPNPFNPSSKVKFQISKLSEAKLVIFDILGREVATLVNEELKPGTYEVDFDGTNYPSGVYYYKLITEDFTETKKMVGSPGTELEFAL